MSKKPVPRNILVAGIPGSGKTTYCQWLEQEKGFLHLDFDELLNGRGTRPKLSLIQHLGHTAEEFVCAISGKKQPIVIDWGFPVGGLTLVRLFKESGFAIWWFDGDRNAAKESFVQRGTVSLDAFTAQMQSIENGWLPIKDVIGDNIINTVTAGPTHVTAESIYERMFSRCASRTERANG